MKNLFYVAAILACLGVRGEAFTLTYEKAASSATVVGVHCSSGATASLFVPSNAGGNIKALRIHNHHGSAAVYLGYSSAITTGTAVNEGENISALAEALAAGGNRDYPVGYDAARKANVPIYCKAADAATSGIAISIMTFRYQ